MARSSSHSEPTDAPEGSFRILCIGDSNTYGTGVERFETYPAEPQSVLNAADSATRFQVTNLGVPGSNSAQVRHRLPQYLELYDPDLVIVLIDVTSRRRSGLPWRREFPSCCPPTRPQSGPTSSRTALSATLPVPTVTPEFREDFLRYLGPSREELFFPDMHPRPPAYAAFSRALRDARVRWNLVSHSGADIDARSGP